MVTFTFDLVIEKFPLLFSAIKNTFCVFDNLILVVAEHDPICGVKENFATLGDGFPSANIYTSFIIVA